MSTTPIRSRRRSRAHGARRVLDDEPRARAASGRSLIQQTRRLELARGDRRSLGSASMSPRETSIVVLEPDRHRHARRRLVDRAVGGVDRRDAACAGRTAARRPRRPRARRRPRPGPRSRGSRGARRTSAGSPTAPGSGGRRGCGRRRSRSPRGARAASRPCHHGIRVGRARRRCRRGAPRSGSPASSLDARARRSRSSSSRSISWKRASSKSTRSILLTANDDVGDARAATRSACGGASARSRPCARRRSTTATSAVEAPVTMLRVYCTWPGASASWKRRRGVTK